MSPADSPDFRAILDQLPVSVFRVNRDMAVTYANARAARLCGRPPAEVVGLTPYELCSCQLDWDKWDASFSQVFATGEPVGEEFYTHGPRGENWLEVRVLPDVAADGTVTAATGLMFNRTELHKLRAELASAETKFRAFMDNMPVICWLRDAAQRYVYLNPAYQQAMGVDPVDWVGKAVADIWPPDVAAQFIANDQKVEAAGRPLHTRETTRTADGAERQWQNVKFVFTDAAGAKYHGGIGVDVTDQERREAERRLVERQLLHAQRQESLGVMAAGVAHDFNNLLTTVMGNAGLVRLGLRPGDPAAENLSRIEAAAVRAADLCNQLLSYTGRGRLNLRELNLTELVRAATADDGPTKLPGGRPVRLDLAATPPPVRGDAAQLRQVLANLLENAGEACGDRPAATVTVATGTADADDLSGYDVIGDVRPGRYVYLEVADTGVGMDEATRGRMFEPFFTTRFVGRGMGLAYVLGVVRAHRGLVAVKSAVGAGTTVRVLLPVAGLPDPMSDRRSAAPAGFGRGRTVLVIDDEPDLRTFCRRTLEAADFRVLLAGTGQEGIDAFRTTPDQIALVVMDVTMPGGMTGIDAFRRLKTIRDGVRVLLTSGYAKESVMAGVDPKELAGFLAKPFGVEELLAAVFRHVGV